MNRNHIHRHKLQLVLQTFALVYVSLFDPVNFTEKHGMVRFEVLHFKLLMRKKLFKVNVKHEFYKKAWWGEIWSFPFKIRDAWKTVWNVSEPWIIKKGVVWWDLKFPFKFVMREKNSLKCTLRVNFSNIRAWNEIKIPFLLPSV